MYLKTYRSDKTSLKSIHNGFQTVTLQLAEQYRIDLWFSLKLVIYFLAQGLSAQLPSNAESLFGV